MLDTVRRSKITPPRLPAAPVARPRVDALLDAAAAEPVTLVSASAGYGKTSAVEAWATTRRVPAAWVSVDAHDNDALHLWRYVIASVERALPGFDEGPRTRVLIAESTAEPTIEVLLAALEDDGRPLTIVLDDLHLVTDRRALGSLKYAAFRLPPNVRLVLLTRVDPPLRLAYLRAAGILAEVRDAELAFTSEEAASLLGPATSEEAEARAKGWPVALRLVALRGAVPVTGRRRDVAAYLTAEVVDGLPDDLRTFLERTSVLPRLSADLCDHVLERDDSAALLDRVVRANLFVVALDEDGLWWRYHALFADYLRLRLGERAAPLHRRACDWFERHGLHEDAIDHAAACGDVEMIARTLEAESGADVAFGAGGDDRALAGAAPARAGQRATGRAHSRARSPPEVWHAHARRSGACSAGRSRRASSTRKSGPGTTRLPVSCSPRSTATTTGDDGGALGPGRRARARGRGHACRARDGGDPRPGRGCSRGRTTPRSSSRARRRSIPTLTGGRSASSARCRCRPWSRRSVRTPWSRSGSRSVPCSRPLARGCWRARPRAARTSRRRWAHSPTAGPPTPSARCTGRARSSPRSTVA